MTQTVQSLPAVRETQVQPLDREDPLAKEMVTHSSILAWRIPWTVVHGVAELDLHTAFSGGRSGGLVFPSFSEFSTVCCNPHSQRLGIVNKAELDFFWNSCLFNDPTNVGHLISGYSAFFKIQLEHLEVHGARTVEAWLGEF